MNNHLGTLKSKAGSLLARFRRDARGNVAIITALCALPLFIAAGVAIDIARSSRSQNALQVAVDAAALSIGASEKANLAGLTSAQKAARKQELKKMAEDFVKANYRDEGEDVTVDVEINNEIIAVEGHKTYPTTLMNLAGFRTVDLGARAEVNMQGIAENIEIILVMDTTGSMKPENKLEDAQAAAKKLIQTVLGDAQSDDKVRFALVPFSGSVNVGADKLTSGWIDTAGKAKVSRVNFTDPAYHNMKGWEDLRYRNSSWQVVKLPWNGCIEARLGALAMDDTPPSAANPDTLFTPYFAPDEPNSFGMAGNNYIDYENGTDEQKIKYQGKYDKKIVNPSDPDSNGPWYNCAVSPIIPLTHSRAVIEAGIDAMQPRGSTNLPEGMMWGLRVMSPGAPYTEGKAFDDKEWRKVVVFMTDGENDVGTNKIWAMPPKVIGTRYTSYGYSVAPIAKNRFGTQTQTAARGKLDDNFKDACTKVKALGEMRESPANHAKRIPSVELYTIGFKVPTDDLKEDLRNCASDPELTGYDYFIDASNGEKLKGAFETIGARLKTLYLSK